jgi:RNA polymerase sigma factor (sigma-70 family)
MESRIANLSGSLAHEPELSSQEEVSAVFVPENLAEFYNSRRNSLFGQAFALVRDRALAEDLTQETFTRLVTEVRAGAKIQSAVRWTSTVLRNLALNHLEHGKVVSRFVEPDSQTQVEIARDEAPSAEDSYLEGETRARLRASLSVLTGLERECVLMFAEGNSYKEIAVEKSLSYGVAVDVVRRSLRKLRKGIPASQG